MFSFHGFQKAGTGEQEVEDTLVFMGLKNGQVNITKFGIHLAITVLATYMGVNIIVILYRDRAIKSIHNLTVENVKSVTLIS